MFSKKKLTSILRQQLTHWNEETIYFDAKYFFDAILNELDRAQNTIEIESYHFQQDTLGEQFINSLLKAAKKKVEVKLIIDGVGSLAWNAAQINELIEGGVKVKVYHPLPWRLSLYEANFPQRKWITQFIYLLSKINKRDHRKLYIVDKKTAWSGSINLTGNHLPNGANKKNWFDCGVKVTGKAVTDLSHSFNEIWQPSHRYAPIQKNLPFRTNNNIFRRQFKNNELTQLIKSASKNIWIINAYLVPSIRIINALKIAKLQGADVKLLISRHSDVIFFPLVSTAYYKLLLNYNIEIYECDEHIIHAKTILLDDILWVGSSNLNHRSFLHDLELDITLTQSRSIDQFKQRFKQLIAQSTPITHAKLSAKPWYVRLAGRALWIFRHWM